MAEVVSHANIQFPCIPQQKDGMNVLFWDNTTDRRCRSNL